MSMDRHDDIAARLADYVLGDVTVDERTAIERHLAGCAGCTDDVRELSLVMHGLARVPEATVPPPALRARVLSAIAAEPRTAAPAPVVRPAQGRGWSSGWLGAAAAVILVLGGSLYRSNERARHASDELRRTDREIADLRHRLDDFAGQTDLALSILTASDMHRIDLRGSASGARAYWSATRGLLVAADQLPLPPSGRVYQVWLIGGGGPVSAGVLGTPRTGRGMLIAPPPGGIATGPVTVAVTDEPPGGLPAPTGAQHLVGSI
jgi:anti-sigma-K factor RskA